MLSTALSVTRTSFVSRSSGNTRPQRHITTSITDPRKNPSYYPEGTIFVEADLSSIKSRIWYYKKFFEKAKNPPDEPWREIMWLSDAYIKYMEPRSATQEPAYIQEYEKQSKRMAEELAQVDSLEAGFHRSLAEIQRKQDSDIKNVQRQVVELLANPPELSPNQPASASQRTGIVATSKDPKDTKNHQFWEDTMDFKIGQAMRLLEKQGLTQQVEEIRSKYAAEEQKLRSEFAKQLRKAVIS